MSGGGGHALMDADVHASIRHLTSHCFVPPLIALLPQRLPICRCWMRWKRALAGSPTSEHCATAHGHRSPLVLLGCACFLPPSLPHSPVSSCCCVVVLCVSVVVVDSSSRPIPLRLGFHAVPSLHLLHMHIVSADLDSLALKNKKHWNSFATHFFITVQQLKDMIKRQKAGAQAAANAFFQPAAAAAASAAPPSFAAQLSSREKLITGDLRCNRVGCNLRCINMSELRTHLQLCVKPYPA